MPKISNKKLDKLVSQFKEEGINSNGDIPFCQFCSESINVDEKHQKNRLESHIKSKKHRGNKEASSNNAERKVQSFITNCFVNSNLQNVFNDDLAKAFSCSGIPFHKLSNPAMKKFLEKYIDKKIPDESTLRKYHLKTIFEETRNKIKELISDFKVCFIVDETTDSMKRFVVNVLVKPLNGTDIKPMLLNVSFLDKVNSSTIAQTFMDSCLILWPSGIKYDKVSMVVTDQATYMIAAFSNLKNGAFDNLKHVTCLAHSLHRACETVRTENDLANDFISCFKRILKKSPCRIQRYKDLTELPIPPEPIVTRWGTWLKSAEFLLTNFDKISLFIEQLEEDSLAIIKCKQLINNEQMKNQLFGLSDYFFLYHKITMLENHGLTKQGQWAIISEAVDNLKGRYFVTLNKYTRLYNKFFV